MPILDFHNQAYTTLIITPIGTVDRLSGDNPINLKENGDGASTQDGLKGSQTSVSSVGSATLTVSCWADSNLRTWAKIQKNLQRNGTGTLFEGTLLTAYGEVVGIANCAVVSYGGYNTGGNEGQAHDIVITVGVMQEVS